MKKDVVRNNATITAVDFIFESPNDVTRKAYAKITFAKEDGSETILVFDLMTAEAKFCYTHFDWKYKKPVHDGFIQLYDLMLFLGAKQPKSLEGCSVIILEKGNDFVLTKGDSELVPRNKVRWWSSKMRNSFEATLAEARKKI